jgi:hypothetical protein
MLRTLRPTSCAKWLGLAYAMLTGWVASGGVGDAPEALLGAPFLWLWLTGAAAFAAMLVKAGRSPVGAWLFVLVELLVAASALWFLVDIEIHRSRWTSVGGSMTLAVTGPMYQYAGVGLAFAVASLFGWRARREWLEA